MILIWQKPFYVVFAINAAVNRPEFLTKTCFFFWTLPSIALKKALNFWRRPFLFFLFSLSIRPEKGLNFWRRPFSFGPLEMVAAR